MIALGVVFIILGSVLIAIYIIQHLDGVPREAKTQSHPRPTTNVPPPPNTARQQARPQQQRAQSPPKPRPEQQQAAPPPPPPRPKPKPTPASAPAGSFWANLEEEERRLDEEIRRNLGRK